MGTGWEAIEEEELFGTKLKRKVKKMFSGIYKKKTYASKHDILIVKECCDIMKYFNIWGRISKCGDFIWYNHGDNVWISYNYCSCCGAKVKPIKYKYKKGRIK